MNTFNLSLDLDKTPDVPDWVTLRQGDKSGTVIIATIYDHGTQLVGSYNARVVIGNPDGEHYYRANATYNAGVATVTVDEQTAASVGGTTVGYFEILQGSTVIASTANFGVRILPSALDGAEPGEVYDSAIQDAIDGLNAAVAELPDTVEDILEDHPEWTTTVQDNSITDAKLIQSGGILDRVERLTLGLGNLLTSTPAEADALTVSDAAKTPLAGLSLYGRSTQDGTPTPSAPVAIQSVQGNLADPSSMFNGYPSNSGIVSASTQRTVYVPCEPNTTYTVSKLITAAADRFAISDSPAVPAGGGTCVRPTIIQGTNSDAYVGVRLDSIYTTSATAKYLLVWIGTDVTHEGSDPAVYVGFTSSDYVPYGCAGVKSVGKNLLKLRGVYTTNGATATISGDSITVTATSANAWSYGRIYLTVPRADADYAMSFNATNLSNVYIGIDFMRADNTRISYVTFVSLSKTFHVPTGTAYLLVYFYSRQSNTGSIGDTNTYSNVQLELGSTATPYQPYAESVTPIDLQGHELRSLPDGTRDEVTVDAYGHAVLVQRVNAVTYDGSSDENWQIEALSGGRGYNYYISASALGFAPSYGLQVMCSHATGSPNSMVMQGRVLVSTARNVNCTWGDALGFTTASDFKAWLTENPITFMAPLATPVTIDLGTIDPVALQGPDMTAQAVPTAPFALTYERDLNIIIGGIYAQLAPVDGPTATSNHGVGTYLMLGGTLCRVTTAIAAGETIAIGTNVVATNVMAEILALTA